MEDFTRGIQETEDKDVHDLNDAVEIAGEGVVAWEVHNMFGATATTHVKACWACMCGTQTCFEENKDQPCSFVQTQDKVALLCQPRSISHSHAICTATFLTCIPKVHV